MFTVSAGVGLRTAHVEEILEHRPDIDWLEVHPENYLTDSAALAQLMRIRRHYPLSLHAVGLSLGSADPLDLTHLERLRALVACLDPFLVSDHLSWAQVDDTHLNELLPLPYTQEALEVTASHIHQVQATLGRNILIENPSSYLRFAHSTLSESEFLAELVRRTGCRVLLDINNLHVSRHNVGLDVAAFFENLPAAAIGEYHLAGHARNTVGARTILIDDHGARVAEEVWTLYGTALQRFGHRPTLIEWDTNIPPLQVLLGEAERARQLATKSSRDRADAA